MFDKPLSQLEIHDIERLINDKVPEGQEIEFKRDMPEENPQKTGNSWEDKKSISNYALKKIIKEIVAFANAYGGVLIIGMDEN